MAKNTWGGYRPGSGRRPKDGVSGVSHHTRVDVSPRHPVLVTLSIKPELGSLRKKRVHEVIRASLIDGCDTGTFRICHYSVQKSSLRFLVEAQDRTALSRGMQGVNVRIAKGLNRLWSRNGSVFTDRYATEVIKNAKKAREALVHVLGGALADPREARKLHGQLDPYSSARYFDGWQGRSPEAPAPPHPVVKPRTALLRKSWRKHGLIDVDEAPDARASD